MPANDSPTRRPELSAAKQAQLERWLQRGRAAAASPEIPRRPQPGPAPLSSSQQRLWFIDQLVPGTPGYTIAGAVRLTGPLHLPALERSLQAVVRRHEALRTTFEARDGEPVQVIAPPGHVALPVVDLQSLPADERSGAVADRARALGRQPFDLARGPLLRLELLRLAPAEHVLLLAMHHIISDGWSSEILFGELMAGYRALVAGEPLSLADLPIQFADFAAWQRQALESPAMARQLAYWREQLQGLPTLELPADRPRPAIRSYQGAVAELHLDRPLVEGLKAVGKQEGATLFMTLLAAFATWLYRYTRQETIPVGVPVAGRSQRELESLIGFFANTLVLRADLHDNPPFRTLLQRVREMTLGALSHQEMPFERLVAELQPERNLSHTPLFQVMFALQNTPTAAHTYGEITLSPIAVHTGTAKCDLYLSMAEGPDGVTGSLEYNTDIFEAETIHRMLDHFRNLLSAIAQDADCRIGGLPLLPAAERRLLLEEWNRTATNYATDRTLAALVEEQVERTPEHVAVIFGAERLTYRELNRRANRLAHRLRQQGVGPDTPVALLMERSMALVVALLAVLKAGGAYLPLDPGLPDERLAFLLEDARPALLLTQQGLMPPGALPVLCVDADEAGDGVETNPVAVAAPDDLAYIIYTSGSTGKPKGVMVSHRAVINRLYWGQELLGLTADDCFLQKTPYSFDVSVQEFFLPLIMGARLVMAPPGAHKEPAQLVRLIGEHGVTMVHFVPSMLPAFVEEPGAERCHSLRRVICSGEALPAEFVDRFFARLNIPLWNLYGPTEAAVDVTGWDCRLPRRSRSVPIGRPAANTRLYVLDPLMQPVPVGVPGELYIGGVQVARGYLNRPDLTAERFLPDPFAAGPGARLYRTGDQVRWLPDGSIEYLGRIDLQVKLRGFRIEPGEIEETLRAHPAVRDAAVSVHEENGSRQLVAYVVPEGEPAGQAAELVTQWQSVFAETYSKPDAPGCEPGLNLAGWTSSYTGQPIAPAEMQEWVDQTVDQILRLRPRRVLEIGCGTGLLLQRIAPHVQHYLGTDFAAPALASLRERLGGLPNVQLAQREADDFTDVEPGSLDAVIINSVVQYFPHVDYLVRVIAGAAARVRPGGFLFIGDVRSLPLLETFHAAVELHRAPADLPLGALADRVRLKAARENELLLAPDFFRALPAHLPGIAGAEVRLKPGRYENELSRFRYDVLLSVGAPVAAPSPVQWLDWEREGLTLPDLARRLDGADLLGVDRVPNRRLRAEVRLLRRLQQGGGATAGELRAELFSRPAEGVAPDDLHQLAAELGFDLHLTWSGDGADGYMAALFRRQGTAPAAGAAANPPALPLPAYANVPFVARNTQAAEAELRTYLKRQMPDYMVPSAFVLLGALPLTPNGKVDRASLPRPQRVHAELATACRTPLEAQLAAIWAAVLGVERVGPHTNFFELGGDSIRAIQVVSRARQQGLTLTTQHLFRYQTVAELAEALPGETAEPAAAARPPERRYVGPDLPADVVEDVYPLTPMQEQMLYRRLHADEPGLYVVHTVGALRGGQIDVPALQRAWQLVVDAHPVLRTAFAWRGLPEPVQVVYRRVDLPMRYLDWRGLAPAEQAARLQAYLQDGRQQGFPLEQTPQRRMTLIQTADADYLIVSHFNYMLQDGWSAPLMDQDLFDAYRALRRGEEPTVARRPLFRHHVEWVRAQAMAAAEAAWRQELAGFAGATPLPGGAVIPGESGMGKEELSLPVGLTERMAEFARRHRLTVNTLLQGAWALLLQRRTGCDDVVFGAVTSGRPERLPGIEAMAGFCLNLLPVRVQVDRSVPAVDWLAALQANQVAMRQFEYCPIGSLYEWLGVDRKELLFQSYLVFENFPFDAAAAAEVDAELGSGETYAIAQTEHPIRVEIFPGERMRVTLTYYRRCVSRELAVELLAEYVGWMDRLTALPCLPAAGLRE